MASDMNLEPGSFSGQGQSTGGETEPNLDNYPLLVWTGRSVKTEDGRASVDQIVAYYARTKDAVDVANHLGTTVEHVQEALAYEEERRLAESEDEPNS
jgi:hypothetical protein